MASIIKHGKKWRAHVYKDGKRRSKTFDLKSKAQSWALSMESQLSGASNSKLTLQELLYKYADQVSCHKKSARWERVRAKSFEKYTISNIRIVDIAPRDIAQHRDYRLTQVTAASVNRELNFLSSVFQHALTEWELISINPVRAIKRPPNPRHRDRRISSQEIKDILKALKFSGNITLKKHQIAVMFLLAIETGMRRGELSDLLKENVFLSDRYLKIIDSKNNDQRDVPLSLKAVELLDLVINCIEGEKVFSVNKDSVTELFKRACREMDIKDLRFHDSRHEAVSRLAQKLDLLDLARMIGHRDPRSLMIYYNPTASEIAGRLD